MHLTPAAFPDNIPGIGEEIDNATQHAPQFSLHFMVQIYKNGAMVQWCKGVTVQRRNCTKAQLYKGTMGKLESFLPLRRYAVMPYFILIFTKNNFDEN
jgi:hypothetical protein